jgi:4-hydroxythreonine-4-phosphate dehydrogenase
MTSLPVLGIIADDLTGGAAVAGEIARDAGSEVEIVRLGHRDPTGGRSVVVETGSRYTDAELSAANVVHARRLLRDCGVDVTMKKIDSTLKGNVATELAAFVSDADGRVIVAPACPAVSLGLRGGRQYRGEAPGRDVAELLATVLDEPPVLLPLDVVRHGVDAVATWLDARDSRVVLADSTMQADLDAVVGGSSAVGVADYAGTYGLGTAFRRGEQHVNRTALPSAERLLVLAGSANPVSVAQLQRLVEEGADEVVVDVRALVTGSRDERARVRSAVAASRSATVVVHTDPGATGSSVTAYRLDAGWSERDLAEHLGGPFVDALEALPEAGVYLIGGETTGAICDRIGWHRFVVTDEVSVAVPLVTEETGARPFVLTKPGAFGARDDLLVAARRLAHGVPSTAS